MNDDIVVTPTKQSERGQSLVELAISLTVILLLLSGAVTFGMGFFSYVALRDAAQEGALWGSFNPWIDANHNGSYDSGEAINEALIRQRVRSASTAPVNLADTTQIPDSFITVETVPVADEPCEGTDPDLTSNPDQIPQAIQVSVAYNYPIIMPYIGGIIGSQEIHLKGTVTDTILEPKCNFP